MAAAMGEGKLGVRAEARAGVTGAASPAVKAAEQGVATCDPRFAPPFRPRGRPKGEVQAETADVHHVRQRNWCPTRSRCRKSLRSPTPCRNCRWRSPCPRRGPCRQSRPLRRGPPAPAHAAAGASRRLRPSQERPPRQKRHVPCLNPWSSGQRCLQQRSQALRRHLSPQPIKAWPQSHPVRRPSPPASPGAAARPRPSVRRRPVPARLPDDRGGMPGRRNLNLAPRP